ncbi:hypothetical protein ABFX02_11G094300 [Erythranthe guttata]
MHDIDWGASILCKISPKLLMYIPLFFPSSSSRNFRFSPSPFVQPQNSVFLDSKSFSNTKRNSDGEFSQDMCSAMSSYNEVGYLPYEDQEFPIISTAQVDLDCLWNY